MYEYTFSDTKKKIDTSGFCKDLSEVQTEVIRKTNSFIHSKFIYPNGFFFESEIYTDKIIIRSNKKLIDNGNGTLSVLDK